MENTCILCFLMIFFVVFLFFLGFSLDCCTGRISKNTLAISLKPAKILRKGEINIEKKHIKTSLKKNIRKTYEKPWTKILENCWKNTETLLFLMCCCFFLSKIKTHCFRTTPQIYPEVTSTFSWASIRFSASSGCKRPQNALNAVWHRDSHVGVQKLQMFSREKYNDCFQTSSA